MAHRDDSKADTPKDDPVADKPMAGGTLNFDDDDMTHPRGNTAGQGGTWKAEGADSGELGPPAEIQSDRIATSDAGKNRQ